MLPAIDEAYRASDEDRRMLQRSMELASAELIKRNNELEGALMAASEADSLRRQFINTAAHELGTPLTPLKLQVHTLRRKGSEVDANTVEILERNVDRLIFLVGDLLDSAKIQTGRFDVVTALVDLAPLVSAAVDSIRPVAEKGNIDLQLEVIGQLPVEADTRRLHQVLENLLTNACKFTPAGGAVRVTVAQDGDWATVKVVDSGIGMPYDGLSQLFQPFVQLHDATVQPVRGSGLGLYICRGIIGAMNGTISGTSEGAGKGSHFEVRLPLVREPAAE